MKYPYPFTSDLSRFAPYRCGACGGHIFDDSAPYGDAIRRCRACGTTALVAKALPPATHACTSCGVRFNGPAGPPCPSYGCPGDVRPIEAAG